MLTYNQAYDLIMDAYLKDEIKPYSISFCPCGILSGNIDWSIRSMVQTNYTYEEYGYMEKTFFEGMNRGFTWCCNGIISGGYKLSEEDIFNGLCSLLDVLKEIHKSRNENVYELPVLKKIELMKV